jgi:hypothetical protein
VIPAPSRLLMLPYKVYKLHFNLSELQPFWFDVLDCLQDLRVDLRCSSAMGPSRGGSTPWATRAMALGAAICSAYSYNFSRSGLGCSSPSFCPDTTMARRRHNIDRLELFFPPCLPRVLWQERARRQAIPAGSPDGQTCPRRRPLTTLSYCVSVAPFLFLCLRHQLTKRYVELLPVHLRFF